MRLINFLRNILRKFIMDEITIQDHIKKGLKIGNNCAIMHGSIFDYGHCELITIGNNVTIAPQAYLLAHDASTKRRLGYTKVAPVIIEDNVFIGARAIIMPGVTVGKNSIIGAGSIVTKDVPSNSVVTGNPAKVIVDVDSYMSVHQHKIEEYLGSTEQEKIKRMIKYIV